MQVLGKELSVKRERWGVLYPIFLCIGSDTEPQSLRVSCPQTMALQMNVIFVPWHSNPCSMMSLSNSRGLFKRLFFMIIMSEMLRTVSGWCVTGILVSVRGRLPPAQRLNSRGKIYWDDSNCSSYLFNKRKTSVVLYLEGLSLLSPLLAISNTPQ